MVHSLRRSTITGFLAQGEPVGDLPGQVTFGAGDGPLQGKEMIECLEFGSASASMLISAHSCSDAMPTAEAVAAFIKKSKEEYGEMVARA